MAECSCLGTLDVNFQALIDTPRPSIEAKVVVDFNVERLFVYA